MPVLVSKETLMTSTLGAAHAELMGICLGFKKNIPLIHPHFCWRNPNGFKDNVRWKICGELKSLLFVRLPLISSSAECVLVSALDL